MCIYMDMTTKLAMPQNCAFKAGKLLNDYCVSDQANSELSHGSSKAAITIKH